MNVLLRDTEEYLDGKHTGSLGLVLIRYVSTPRLSLQIEVEVGFGIGIGIES